MNAPVTSASGTGIVFADTDISQITTGSFFVYNSGASAFIISLQVSPAASDALYVTDTDNEELPAAVGVNMMITISKFSHYARHYYDAGADFGACYIGQM